MKVRRSLNAFARLLTLVISGLVVLAITVAPTAMASAILDEDNSVGVGPTAALGVDSSQFLAQIITPGISGSLTKVALGFSYRGTVTNLTIGIYQAASGVPTGSALASTTITDFTGMSTGGQTMFDIDFASPTAVTAGSTYAIVATSTDSFTGGDFLWYNSLPYAGGDSAYNFGGGPWMAIPSSGLTFSTYVLISGSSSGSSSSASGSSAPRVETLTLSATTNGTTCTGGNPSGYTGSWLALPSADECTQTGPDARADAVLLGWSTSPNFPVARAQDQIKRGWGVIDEEIGGIRMIFIPGGMSTFVSSSNTLYPIWSA
jgi:hypothetical protein